MRILNLPNLRGKADGQVEEAIREITQAVNELTQALVPRVDDLNRQITEVPSLAEIRDQLQIGGTVSLNLTGLLGSLKAEEGVGLTLRTDGTSAITGSRTISGLFTFNPSTGTVPFIVDASKNSIVTNLNADLLDGLHASSFVQGTLEAGSGNVMRVDGTTTLSGARAVTAQWTFPTLRLITTAPSIVFEDTDVGDDDYTLIVDNDAFIMSQGVAVVFQILADKTCKVEQIRSDSDIGGQASSNTITGVTDTPTVDPGWTTSSTVDMNAPDGYIKAYSGTQAVVIPFWNT